MEMVIPEELSQQILPAKLVFVENSAHFKQSTRKLGGSWFEEVSCLERNGACHVVEVKCIMSSFELRPQTDYHVILRMGGSASSEGCSSQVELSADESRASGQVNQHNWVQRCVHHFTYCPSGTHLKFRLALPCNGPLYVDAVLIVPELAQPHALPAHDNSVKCTGQPFSCIGTDVKPIRLININKTLHSHGGVFFCEAQSWDFHVISHTWSAAIRKLSQEIAQIRPGDCSYASMFENVDLSKEPAYQSVMDFLRILRSDGVEDVWFDALCINQLDDEEKCKEIAHMGAYYMHSKGCYVIKHGIGKGYKLATKRKGGGYDIARWFTRAWTLQEYILPRNLIFLADSLPKRLKHLVNHCIISTSHHIVCKCNFTKMEQILSQALSLGIDNFKFVDPRAKIDEIIGSDEGLPCCKCAKMPFIRKVNLARLGEQSKIYFVERLFYGFLLRCFHVSIVGQEDSNSVLLPVVDETHQKILPSLSMPLYGNDAWGGKVRKLEQLIKVCDMCRSEGFYLSGIKGRAATHKEDLVLSIMALLGVEGRMQVRTNKSLVEQFVELAKVATPDLLVEICTNCINPNDKLSWIPSLDHVPCSHLPLSHEPFERGKMRAAVVKEGVTPRGFLSLWGKATQARLVFEKNSIHLHDVDSAASFCMACNGALNSAACSNNDMTNKSKKEKISHLHAKCSIDAGPCSKLPLEANVFMGARHSHGIIVSHLGKSTYQQDNDEYFPYTDGGLCIAEGYRNIQDIMQYPIDVWMLLMGERYQDADGYWVPLGMRSKVVMVCIGTLENLHKIGVIRMDSVSCAGFFSSKLNPAVTRTSYAIGGHCVHRFWPLLASVLPFRQRPPCKSCNYWCDRSFRLAFATASTLPPTYRPYRADRPSAKSCCECGRLHMRTL